MSNSEVAGYYLNQGTQKLNEKRYREALPDLDCAIKLYAEGYALTCFRRGGVHVQLGNTSKSEVDFENALHFATEADDEQLQTTIKKALRLLRGDTPHERES